MPVPAPATAQVGTNPTPIDPSRLRISGRVTEPAANVPVEGATVCWGPSPLRCAETGPDGTYLLVADRPIYPPGVRSARLAPFVRKDGFENRQSWIPDDFSGFLFWSPGMQRILRIEAGGSIAGTVYPLEGVGLVDDGCEACKKIQVTVPRAGELIVRLVVGSDRLRLIIAREDLRQPDAPLAVEAGVTVDVFVTNAVEPTAFELTTALTSR